MALFHHHHDKDTDSTPGAVGKAKLHGIVIYTAPSQTGPGMVVVRVRVRMPGGRSDVEFSEEMANLYQPTPGSPEAQRLIEMREATNVGHPNRIPKIQLPLWSGSRIPVRYNGSNRKKLIIDTADVQRQALDEYIERETRPRQSNTSPSAAATAAVTGPPWRVPTECPTCGARVDQAVSSKQADPKCPFCHEPIPVEPLNGA